MKPQLVPPSISALVPPASGAAAQARATFVPAPSVGETGLADFNERAGIDLHAEHHRHRKVPLARRLQLQRPATGKSQRGSGASPARLEDALQRLLETLAQDGGESTHDDLPHDPLQRYTLLQSAFEQVSAAADGDPQKAHLARRLAAMRDEVERAHGPALREGRERGASFEDTLRHLEQRGGAASSSHLREHLDSRFGARGGEPVSPARLFDALLAQAGPEHCLQALGRARALQRQEMATRRPGPRLWLSLADAAAFNVVQGCAAQAQQLRETISARARILPAGTLADTTALLLHVGARHEEAADHLLSALEGGGPPADPGQRAQLAVVLREHVRRLPDALWPGGAAARGALVHDLGVRAAALQAQLSPAIDAPGRLEQRLRRRWQQEGTPLRSDPISLSSMEK